MQLIPKVTGFFVWIAAIAGVLPFFSDTTFGQSPSPSCGCVDVTVTLNDTTCTFRLDTNIVRMNGGLTSCTGTNITVRVADNNPLNGDVIDCPGTYTYGLFQGSTLLCWGRVTAEDKSGPKLVEWDGRCNKAGNGSVGTAPAAGAPLGVTLQDPNVIRRDTFLCMDIDQVYNVSASWTDASNAYFAGRPIFQDGCHNRRITPTSGGQSSGTTVLCDCRTDLRVNDQIVYYPCPLPTTVGWTGVWAQITRVFTATDCMDNRTTTTQTITFVRPPVTSLAAQVAAAGGSFRSVIGDGSKTRVFLDNGIAAPSPRLMVIMDSTTCASETDAELVQKLRSWYYIFDDTLKCDNAARDDYAYFAQGASASSPRRPLLQCNYSFDTQIISTSSDCSRKKVVATTNYFDWCTGVKVPLDTIEIQDVYQPAQSLRQQIVSAGGNLTSGGSSATLNSNQVEVTLGPDNCKPLQAGEMLKIFLERFYLFQNTGSPPVQNITFFEHETTFGYSKKWLECSNSTLSSIIVAEVIHVTPTIAAERKKVSVRVFQKDECSGQETVLDENVLLR